jgi:hypothetical protein
MSVKFDPKIRRAAAEQLAVLMLGSLIFDVVTESCLEPQCYLYVNQLQLLDIVLLEISLKDSKLKDVSLLFLRLMLDRDHTSHQHQLIKRLQGNVELVQSLLPCTLQKSTLH